MTKHEIFDDAVSIMKNDASFCRDEKGGDPAIYRSRISEDMDGEAFLQIMQEYLATFCVKGHLSFSMKGRRTISFRVKRWKDALYVTEAAEDSEARVGDKIIRVDGVPVAEYARIHETMLYREPEERQGFGWTALLSYAKNATISDPSGEERTIAITIGGKWAAAEKYYCKQIRDDAAYMRLCDFSDDIAIAAMYENSDDIIRRCKNLIIDVRGNGGGNDSAFFPLLKYCLPCGQNAGCLKEGIFDRGMEINYSPRNCDARLEQFESYLKNDLPPDTRNMLSGMVEQLRSNYGKGFIREADDDLSQLPYLGAEIPEKVFIICDEDCASSGDAFADMMRKSEKVTVVGRPTMGICDFSNCTRMDYGDYVLYYPTSRLMCLDHGVQMRGHGVGVDVHVPWTPAHLKKDIDLEKVFEIIDKA